MDRGIRALEERVEELQKDNKELLDEKETAQKIWAK